MRRILSTSAVVTISTLMLAGPAGAQFGWSAEVAWAHDGPTPVSLYVLPDGQGKPFTEAFEFGFGVTTDATIHLTLYDAFMTPIANFPAEDMWLASLDDGMVPCPGGASADRDTDTAGTTLWAEPLFAGGSSEELCTVFVNGDAVTSMAGLDLRFNSADMDGSGVVNLTDAGYLAGLLGAPYDHAGDFNFDGVINISDMGFMAAALGTACP
jgi:hypothetical protein